MTLRLQIILIVGILFYFFIVIRLLKQKKLSLKYSLLWLLVGFVLLIMAIFPQLLVYIKTLFGFYDSMNALLIISLAFSFMISMALTSIVSKQSEKIKNLIQDNALLEKRIREIENTLKFQGTDVDNKADKKEGK